MGLGFEPGRQILPQRLGRYTLQEELGEGSVGTVYLAHGPDGPCAVKVLRTLLAQDEAARGRFVAGGKAMARIEHPHLLRVYEVVTEGASPFIALEFAKRGPLLTYIVRYGPIGPRRTAQIGMQLASALHALHDVGLVHRDVKPANVLINDQGRVKLSDLGLPAPVEELATLPDSALQNLCYAAPELLADARITDPRSDFFGLGATLWTMCTGELAKRLLGAGQGPSLVNVPPALEPIIERCTAFETQDRYGSAAELFEALERALEEIPPDTQAGAKGDGPTIGNLATGGLKLSAYAAAALAEPPPATLADRPTHIHDPHEAASEVEQGGIFEPPAPEEPPREVVIGADLRASSSVARPAPTSDSEPPIGGTMTMDPQPASIRRAEPARPTNLPAMLGVATAGALVLLLGLVLASASIMMGSAESTVEAARDGMYERLGASDERIRTWLESEVEEPMLTSLYNKWRRTRGEPARIEGALRFVAAAEMQRGELRERLSKQRYKHSRRVISDLVAARQTWTDAMTEWHETAASPLGTIAVITGLAPEPDPLLVTEPVR